MKKLYNKFNKMVESLWFMTIGLITVPFFLCSSQNNKYVYWALALMFYIRIIKDFLKALIRKYNMDERL